MSSPGYLKYQLGRVIKHPFLRKIFPMPVDSLYNSCENNPFFWPRANNMITRTVLTTCDILQALMFKRGLKTAQLARAINMPQQTLQRIVTGVSPKPHQSSFDKLAAYFQVSTEQLKGLSPIPELTDIIEKFSPYSGIKKVALLRWSDLINPAHVSTLVSQPQDSLTFTDAAVGSAAFALRMNDASMEPMYPEGTLLVVDPEQPAKDRRFVIATLAKQSSAMLRMLVIDGNNRYLKALSPDMSDFQMTKMGANDAILGVLVQAKYNLLEAPQTA